MEAFMENPGLCHIGEKILRYLDFKTQLSCRLVNKSWNLILETEATKSKIDLKKLQPRIKKSLMAGSGRNGKSLNEDYDTFARGYDWIHFVGFIFPNDDNPWINIYLQKYIKYQIENGFPSNPLQHFAMKRNVKIVNFILEEILYETCKRYNWNKPDDNYMEFKQTLKLAIENQDTEIVECFKAYLKLWKVDFPKFFKKLRKIS